MADLDKPQVEGTSVDMGEVLRDMTFPVGDISSLDLRFIKVSH